MSVSAGDARLARAKEELAYNTPLWAGGYVKTAEGWRAPGPRASFKGVAKILDKSKKLVTIVPNAWQLEFDDLLEGQRAEGKPMRAIVLKSRQLGFSTWVALKFIQRVTQLEYQQAVIVAQDVKTAGKIFDMAKLCHSHLPTIEELELGFNIRPHIIGESNSLGRKFMQFGEGSRRLRHNGRTSDSIIEIDTAGSTEAGRGGTPNLLHLSEFGRWEGGHAQQKVISLLNGVPQEPETLVVIESTANGLNHFYRRWVSAKEGEADPLTGENYVSIFVSWWRDPKAVLPFATGEDRERFESSIGDTNAYGEAAEDEPMLVEAYGLQPEQLAWRRMMIRTQHNSDLAHFNQEFPHSDEAAFIGSGRTFFGGVLITRAIKAAEEAQKPVTGTLRGIGKVTHKVRGGVMEVPAEAKWVAGPDMRPGEHELVVWEHPVRASDEWPETVPTEERVDGAYVVSVDVAGGEGANYTEGDFHCVQVFDHRTRRQVAVHASRMRLEELPMFVFLIATYYNRAVLAPEINNHGIHLVETLDKSYRYPRMFQRHRFDVVAKDTDRNKLGWRTDQVSKPMMEGTFATALAEGTHGIRDVRTARELNTYVIDEKGKHGAQAGEHDDRLMAAMINHQVMTLMRPPPRRRRKARTVWQPSDPLTGY